MNRQTRYENFEKFANDAEARFNELRDRDERAKVLSSFYSFHVVKGGAMGGVDKRVVEVFFGNRPIDRVRTVEHSNGSFPQSHDKLLTERGVTLRYERTDTGTVICTLYPANSQNISPREDSIILNWIADPKALQSRFKLQWHWKAFISYMECTSLDGEPTVFDRILVGYLRFTCLLVVDGRVGKRKVIEAIGTMVGYVFTIGLSGFLLLLINMAGSSSDAEKVKVEIKTTSRQLSEANGVIQAQNERIASLERRIDAIQAVKAERP